MAKRSSYQPAIRNSAYYERLGMEVELERLQKQADEIRSQLRKYPVRILQQAQMSFTSTPQTRVASASGSAVVRRGKRTMSAAARKRISEAQKARWAKQRVAAGGQSPAPGATQGARGAARRRGRTSAASTAARGPRKRTMSAEARKRIADAQRRRWAQYRKQKA